MARQMVKVVARPGCRIQYRDEAGAAVKGRFIVAEGMYHEASKKTVAGPVEVRLTRDVARYIAAGDLLVVEEPTAAAKRGRQASAPQAEAKE